MLSSVYMVQVSMGVAKKTIADFAVPTNTSFGDPILFSNIMLAYKVGAQTLFVWHDVKRTVIDPVL